MENTLSITVGKFTLESLTTGMYSDARIIYREYIQNAVDSLENAVNQEIIESDEMRINIIIDSELRHISIRDNGTGVTSIDAPRILLNIGDSTKRSSNSRGFRGIGRLGGMSYCDKLIFTTTAVNEDKCTTITFDCAKLRHLLGPDVQGYNDLATLLSDVTDVKYGNEKKDAHYFAVDLYGVDETTGLLDDNDVKTYIEEVAPLPYSKLNFYRSTQVEQYMEQNSYEIEEFPIFLGTSYNNIQPLHKLNKVRFRTNRGKREPDEIDEIVLFPVKVDGEVVALGWYADCSWRGMLSDQEMAGLRVRKGNILIGDRSTLNPIFGTQTRFNGYVQGEIFVISDKLVPNARRDDFEKNDTYLKFIQVLKTQIGFPIISKIRAASQKRNDVVSKTIKKANNVIDETKNELSEGFNSKVDKAEVIQNLVDIQDVLDHLPTTIDTERQKITEELKKTVEDLANQVADSNHYRLDDVTKTLDRKSKKMLQIVSEVLSEKLSKDLANLILDGIKEKLREK